MNIIVKISWATTDISSDGLIVRPYITNLDELPVELLDEEVTLARIPDHCFFALGDFRSHDNHTPRMHSTAEASKYMARIEADIAKLNVRSYGTCECCGQSVINTRGVRVIRNGF